MIDIQEDKKQSLAWLDSNEEMTKDELVALAITGHAACEGYCGSREVCGEDACFCVRAHFATPSHYALYVEMRKLAKAITAIAKIAEMNKYEYRDD